MKSPLTGTRAAWAGLSARLIVYRPCGRAITQSPRQERIIIMNYKLVGRMFIVALVVTALFLAGCAVDAGVSAG